MLIESFKHLAESKIQVEWIVENLLSPGGWTFLVGATKTGKSIMMIQLCAALQKGESFLGFKTKRHNCLYIQADAGLIEWKVQVERLAGSSFAWTAHQLKRGFLDNSYERQVLKELIWGTYPDTSPLSKVCKHTPFDFVVFDCLHALTDGDINTKVGGSVVLKHLEELVTCETDQGMQRVHYVLVHHPNAGVKRGTIAGSGWKGFSDACTTKLTLGGTLLRLEGSKIAAAKDIELERDHNGGWHRLDTIHVEYAHHKLDYAQLLGITL